MRQIIVNAADSVRSSYWFIPGVMAFAALVLGAVMVWVDSTEQFDWVSGLGWYQSIKPDGAHQVLSTIAGSMITVAGVVFSITIVAIAYASSQFGPRVLSNFMSDRGNKITLGTFIATFTYCLVVLRTIRGGDDGSFVPQNAVLVGLLLAFCSIGVLIYFIHHVPQTIHINNVVAQIGTQLIKDVERRFPSLIGEPASQAHLANAAGKAIALAGPARPIRGTATGYVQRVEDQALMKVATSHDLTLRLRYRPGDYVMAGRTLMEAFPCDHLPDEALSSLEECYTVGNRRTPTGDLEFLINELVEIATRALSSGINDPTTAGTCIDWLGAGATEISRRRLPSPMRLDEEKRLRVIAVPDTFEDYVERAFGRLRQYAARDMNAALHLLRTLGEVAASCSEPEQIEVLAAEVERLSSIAEHKLVGASLARYRARACELQRILAGGATSAVELQAEWLGGSA